MLESNISATCERQNKENCMCSGPAVQTPGLSATRAHKQQRTPNTAGLSSSLPVYFTSFHSHTEAFCFGRTSSRPARKPVSAAGSAGEEFFLITLFLRLYCGSLGHGSAGICGRKVTDEQDTASRSGSLASGEASYKCFITFLSLCFRSFLIFLPPSPSTPRTPPQPRQCVLGGGCR